MAWDFFCPDSKTKNIVSICLGSGHLIGIKYWLCVYKKGKSTPLPDVL